MEKILVLTDFSKIANKGLETAVHIAKQLGGAEIFLLNTERDISGRRFSASADYTKQFDPQEDRYMIELIRTNQKRLLKLQETYSADKVVIKPFIEIGPLQDIVDEFLEKRKISLIVMGTSGESTFEEYFVGNHSEQVIRIADVPVITVKLSDRLMDYRNIVLATDMNKDAARGLAHIDALALKLGAKIHLVHVTNGDLGKAKRKLEEYARSNGFSNHTISVVHNNDTEDGLKTYSAQIGADMIAVITQGRSGLSALLTNSVAEDVIKEASIPVLTVNMKEVK